MFFEKNKKILPKSSDFEKLNRLCYIGGYKQLIFKI